MRVAYLTSQYPAASHTFIRREVAAIRASGIEIETFALRPPDPDECRDANARSEHSMTWYLHPPRPAELIVRHLRQLVRRPLRYGSTLAHALRHRVGGVKALVWSLFHFAEAVALADELELRRITHLHCHFANSGATVGLLASELVDVGFSLTLHGTSELDYPAGPLLGEKLARARFAACASWFMRAQGMRVVSPEHWAKLLLVRCGVELDRLPVPCPASEDGGRLRVVSVGRLSPEKGHLGLIDAFSKVVASGIDAELRLIGDGPESQHVRAHAEHLGLGDRLALPGRASESEVLEEIASADVFVLSSLMEGLPVVLMEALALRVPVVAPSVAGIPELVQDGVTGLLFPASDWGALEGAIKRMLSDPELRERTATAGRERIEAEYAIDRAVAPLAERFRSS